MAPSIPMKRLLPGLTAVLGVLAGCGEDGGGGEGGADSARYSADLRPLNGSGVTGKAAFESQEDGIAVRITASGLEPGQILPTYVKGFAGTREARCPDSGDDLSAREARVYGDTVFALEPFPTIKPGEATLRHDLTLTPSEGELRRLEPLERRTLVLQAGEGPRTVPVACGEISAAE